jgi:beta-fructofuranosidase
VLIVSQWTDGRLGPVSYLVGDLLATGMDDDDAPRFVPTGGGRVDWGGDFYAPAVLIEPDRTLMWGWSWESRPAAATTAAGWAGVLTFPREVGIRRDGRLTSTPAAELTALRRDPALVDEQFSVGAGAPIDVTGLPPYADISVTVVTRGRGWVDVGLLASPEGHRLLVSVRPSTGAVWLARDGWPAVPARDTTVRAYFTPTEGAVPVRILLDGPVVEVFVAGEVTITERVYPRAEDRSALSLASRGADADVGITCWTTALPR